MKIMRRKWIKLTTEEKSESRQIEQIDVNYCAENIGTTEKGEQTLSEI